MILVSGAAVVVLLAWVLLAYNRLIRARNQVSNALAQIDVQLTRRHDLIPNLIEVAKGYMAQERETLLAVTTARTAAVGAQRGSIAEVAGAETGLTQTLARFFLRAEDYPDLKANETMMQLSEELTSAENRVAYARQAYNDAVLAYNTRCQVFPINLLAGGFGFAPAALWEAEFTGVKDTPEVAF